MFSEEPTNFWKLWKEDLKVSFPKKRLTDALQARWKLAHPNVLARLKQEKFRNMAADIKFLNDHFGICFTVERGFYFDEKKFIEIQEEKLKNNAKKLGMSK